MIDATSPTALEHGPVRRLGTATRGLRGEPAYRSHRTRPVRRFGTAGQDRTIAIGVRTDGAAATASAGRRTARAGRAPAGRRVHRPERRRGAENGRATPTGT